MEPDQNGRIILNYPILIIEGQQYLSYPDFIDLSGLPKTSLSRVISLLPDVPKIYVKNRAYFRLDFCLRYHRWAKGKN
jgi:hypothetical protein